MNTQVKLEPGLLIKVVRGDAVVLNKDNTAPKGYHNEIKFIAGEVPVGTIGFTYLESVGCAPMICAKFENIEPCRNGLVFGLGEPGEILSNQFTSIYREWASPNDPNHDDGNVEVDGVSFFAHPYQPYLGKIGNYGAIVSDWINNWCARIYVADNTGKCKDIDHFRDDSKIRFSHSEEDKLRSKQITFLWAARRLKELNKETNAVNEAQTQT